MRKIVALLLCLSMAFTLVGCSSPFSPKPTKIINLLTKYTKYTTEKEIKDEYSNFVITPDYIEGDFRYENITIDDVQYERVSFDMLYGKAWEVSIRLPYEGNEELIDKTIKYLDATYTRDDVLDDSWRYYSEELKINRVFDVEIFRGSFCLHHPLYKYSDLK